MLSAISWSGSPWKSADSMAIPKHADFLEREGFDRLFERGHAAFVRPVGEGDHMRLEPGPRPAIQGGRRHHGVVEGRIPGGTRSAICVVMDRAFLVKETRTSLGSPKVTRAIESCSVLLVDEIDGGGFGGVEGAIVSCCR